MHDEDTAPVRIEEPIRIQFRMTDCRSFLPRLKNTSWYETIYPTQSEDDVALIKQYRDRLDPTIHDAVKNGVTDRPDIALAQFVPHEHDDFWDFLYQAMMPTEGVRFTPLAWYWALKAIDLIPNYSPEVPLTERERQHMLLFRTAMRMPSNEQFTKPGIPSTALILIAAHILRTTGERWLLLRWNAIDWEMLDVPSENRSRATDVQSSTDDSIPLGSLLREIRGIKGIHPYVFKALRSSILKAESSAQQWADFLGGDVRAESIRCDKSLPKTNTPYRNLIAALFSELDPDDRREMLDILREMN